MTADAGTLSGSRLRLVLELAASTPAPAGVWRSGADAVQRPLYDDLVMARKARGRSETTWLPT
jgi:hypothetical protein